jgi:3-oxoacyl-[acyl-carrier-protein] synthase-3
MDAVDYFIFHQSNRFIMQHLAKKAAIPKQKIPLTIEGFGSAGGPSVPLTITRGLLDRLADRALRLLLITHGALSRALDRPMPCINFDSDEIG